MVDIQDIVENIVTSIDKTIKIGRIDNEVEILTKLYVCELKWLEVGSDILDEEDRPAQVTEIGSNYIVVRKQDPFVWTSKTITIVKDIYYFRGTPLATNVEWLEYSNHEGFKTPFVWLVEPTTEVEFANGQGLERESDLRIYFLTGTLAHYTVKQKHDITIAYLRTWVEGFKKSVDKNKLFANVESYTTKNISFFGVESPQGYEANIIDANLSAIELRFTLPIRKRANCLC